MGQLSGTQAAPAGCPLRRRSPRLGTSLKRHRTQPHAPGVAWTVGLAALPARRSPARDRAVPWPSRNPESNTAGRHLLPTGRSFRFNGTGSCQGGYAAQVSLGVLTSVSRTSAAAAPCRLARHLAAGNAVTVRSTARRLNSLPLVGAEPLARAASAFARRRSQSILGDVL